MSVSPLLTKEACSNKLRRIFKISKRAVRYFIGRMLVIKQIQVFSLPDSGGKAF